MSSNMFPFDLFAARVLVRARFHILQIVIQDHDEHKKNIQSASSDNKIKSALTKTKTFQRIINILVIILEQDQDQDHDIKFKY